jgi:cytochrome b pre-mRNA-processing protein 3
MLNPLSGSQECRRAVAALYRTLVAQARQPVFFRALGVPDTVDGRFDLLALYAWLVLDRLKGAGARELSQGLTDTLFVGFDEGLRELGAGDMGMGRRMKKLADAFYGRLAAYDSCRDEAAFASALLRNLYRGVPERVADAASVARYTLAAREILVTCDIADGIADFGPPPAGAA